MNLSFETLEVGEEFVNAGVFNLLGYLCLASILLFILKITLLRNLKIMNIVKPIVITIKFVTCTIAVFFVFFFDFQTHKIVLIKGPMLLSTFLVGSLAVWEILSMIADYLKSIEDINDD